MTTDHPDPHHEDLLMVATAYREALLAGGGGNAEFQASLGAFLKHHPECPSDKAGDVVDRLIVEAIVEYGGWLYSEE